MTPALARLRELAEKATPGEWFPWNAYKCAGGIHPQDDECVHVSRLGPAEVADSMGIVADNGRVDMHGRRADFEYIAAANPKVILALLAALQQREAALETIETLLAETLGPVFRVQREAILRACREGRA